MRVKSSPVSGLRLTIKDSFAKVISTSPCDCHPRGLLVGTYFPYLGMQTSVAHPKPLPREILVGLEF